MVQHVPDVDAHPEHGGGNGIQCLPLVGQRHGPRVVSPLDLALHRVHSLLRGHAPQVGSVHEDAGTEQVFVWIHFVTDSFVVQDGFPGESRTGAQQEHNHQDPDDQPGLAFLFRRFFRCRLLRHHKAAVGTGGGHVLPPDSVCLLHPLRLHLLRLHLLRPLHLLCLHLLCLLRLLQRNRLLHAGVSLWGSGRHSVNGRHRAGISVGLVHRRHGAGISLACGVSLLHGCLPPSGAVRRAVSPLDTDRGGVLHGLCRVLDAFRSFVVFCASPAIPAFIGHGVPLLSVYCSWVLFQFS